MSHTRSARPALLEINHDGPIRMTRVGKAHQGLVWEVQPENFDTVIEMINTFGGPDAWRIEKL